MPFQPRTLPIAITLSNGEVAIMRFITLGRGGHLPQGATWVRADHGVWSRDSNNENIAYEVAKTFAGHEEQPLNWRIISEADVPEDRTYRGAWTDDGKAIVHDLEKAREIHRGMLRAVRAPKLAALDVAYQRADEDGSLSEKAGVASQKQVLRDLTDDPAIDAAQTIDELKACWPEVLK